MVGALIPAPIFLSAGSADRNLIDRSYEVIKLSSLVSFGVNVITNASTGTTFFRVTFDAAPIGCNINVPPGVTGIFTVIDFPSVFLPQRHVDVAVDNDTGVGAITATCLINLNA